MPKKFSWSWSKLKNFRTCPKRHFHVDLQKDYREDESEQLIWGDQVHKAMAARIDKGTPLPHTMQHYNKWPDAIAKWKDAGMKVLVEQKLAITDKFTPSSFFDGATWFRGVADALALAPRVAYAFDWKTGQVKPDYEQLALNAALVFAHHPEIEEIGTSFVWLGNDTESSATYRRDDMMKVWNSVMPEVKVMAEAHRTTTYPPKPSGLCKRYCPVTSCPYYGKGNQ
jgi:hypothetical protein